KTNSGDIEGINSLTGGVVVMRKSSRSLYRVRSPTMEIPEEVVVETRSTPLNGFGRPGKASARNRSIWPNPARLYDTGAGNPAVDPSRLLSSRMTLVGVEVSLATAMPL